MSNISQYLANILAARYGKDVRQSIHDAIEEVDRVADTAQNSATASAASAAKFAGDAEDSATAAETAQAEAESARDAAEKAKTAAGVSEANAAVLKTDAESAAGEATDAKQIAQAAQVKAETARTVAETAKTAAETAQAEAESARDEAEEEAANAKIAEQGAVNARAGITEALQAAQAAQAGAEESAVQSQNYATGASDSAKYYYEQAKSISESFAGALRPMGTVAFANLPSVASATEGDMYNVSNQFTTTSDFKEGAGNVIPAGANVYLTADKKWDVLAGSPVTSVNGQRGNVSITPANIGALPEDGNAASATKAMQDGNGNNIPNTYQTKIGDTNNNSVTFTSADSASPTTWTDTAPLKSGEKHSSILNKVSTMFKNVRFLYKMLGTTNISAIGGGTVTGAIASQNETFTNQITSLNTDLDAKIKTLINKTTLSAGETTYALGQYGYARSGMILIYATSSIDTEVTVLLLMTFSDVTDGGGSLSIIASNLNYDGTQTGCNRYYLWNGHLCIYNKQSVHEYLTVKFIPFF